MNMVVEKPESEKIRVLMLTTDSAISGTERIILSLLKHLDRRRFDAALVALFGPGDLVRAVEELGYPALNLRLKEDSCFSGWREGWKFLNRFRPRVIQSLLIHSNLVGRAAVFLRPNMAMLAGISTVYTIAGYGKTYAWLERLTHPLDTLYVVNSELGMRNVLNLIGLQEQKLALVHNGIEISAYEDNLPAIRSEVRREFGFSEAQPVIGIVAQLRPAKRHDLLIQAAARLKPQFPNLRVLIVGEGETEAALKELVRQLGMDMEVIFTGYRRDAPRLMRGLDLFALPSVVEGEPISVLEAMDAGLPVAAAATGGIPEIVQSGVTGFLARPGDLDEFCHALQQLLADPERRKSLGRAGRERVRIAFSAERMTVEFQQLYERCAR